MSEIGMISATVDPGQAWRLLKFIKGKKNAPLVRAAILKAHNLEGFEDRNAIKELQAREENIAEAQRMVGGLSAIFIKWNVPDD